MFWKPPCPKKLKSTSCSAQAAATAAGGSGCAAAPGPVSAVAAAAASMAAIQTVGRFIFHASCRVVAPDVHPSTAADNFEFRGARPGPGTPLYWPPCQHPSDPDAPVAELYRGSPSAGRQWADLRRPGTRDGRRPGARARVGCRSEEHTSELQSHSDLVCRLLLEKKKKTKRSFELARKKSKKTKIS